MGQGARADVVGHLRGLEIIQERDDGHLQFIAGGGDGEKQPWAGHEEDGERCQE